MLHETHIFPQYASSTAHTVEQLFEALSFKPKFVVSIPDWAIGVCIDLSFPQHWEPQPPGTLRPCPDLYRDCFAFLRFLYFTSRSIPEWQPCPRYLRISRVFYDFEAHLQNCEKRLLASSCLSVRSSVRPFAWNNSAPTGWIFMKFDIWGFFESLSRYFKFH